MGGLDTSGLLPADVVAALPSISRRLGEALDARRFDGDEARRDAAARVPGADGHSAVTRLAHLSATVRAADRCVAALALQDGGLLPDELPADDPAAWTAQAGAPVLGMLHTAQEALRDLAARLDALAPEVWGSAGIDRSGAQVALLDLLRVVVGRAAADLRAVQGALDAADPAR